MARLRLLLGIMATLPGDLFRLVLIHLPGQSGILLRRHYYSSRLRRCGTGLTIHPGVHISGLPLIEAGDDVMIRENVIIHTSYPNSDDEERRHMVKAPQNAQIERGVVSLGSHCRIAFGALILGYGGVRIGEKSGIGPGSVILSESFHHKGKEGVVYKYSQGADPEEQCVVYGSVEFKDGAGVASNVVVLPGATIGKDSWVLPNSVVRLSARIPDNVIAKGDPAVPVLSRQVDS
jgi:acetyltransferase-like isoleucine patch superfamily enzyme